MNTASQYFYLLRWLLFPSMLYSILLAVVLASGVTSMWFYLSGQVHVGKIFSLPAILLYSILLFNFLSRFPLLFCRQTMALTGILAWRLTLIGFTLITLWSLAVAPAMVGTEGLISVNHWLRAAILIFSFVTLLIYLGAATRLNLFLVCLVFLGIGLGGSGALYAAMGSAWRQGSTPLYGTLLLLTIALWTALYIRTNRARLPRPLGDGLDQRSAEGPQRSFWEQNFVAALIPRLTLPKSIKSPRSVLLLETTQPALSYILLTLGCALPIALPLALLIAIDGLSFREWLPFGAAVLLPMIFLTVGMGAISGNARRLWLISDSRTEVLKQIERGYARSVGPGLTIILILSITLMADQRPAWWLLSWAALVALVGTLAFYLHLLTTAWDHFLVPVGRFLLGIFLLGAIIVFWSATLPMFNTVLVTTLLVGALIARRLGREYWLRMDYSLLGGKVARI